MKYIQYNQSINRTALTGCRLFLCCAKHHCLKTVLCYKKVKSMDYTLNTIEARILGVLIEKEISTPDYYPMTLNALVNACNQKTNRDPVMDLEESAVDNSLEELMDMRLVRQVKQQGSRALKYEHSLKDITGFSSRELALICELLLRGPQTAGELRSRTARLTEFGTLQAVEMTLQKLINNEKGPYAVQLPLSPGKKENRYAHLFFKPDSSGEVFHSPESDIPLRDGHTNSERISLLEEKVGQLEAEIRELQKQFSAFQKQFE